MVSVGSRRMGPHCSGGRVVVQSFWIVAMPQCAPPRRQTKAAEIGRATEIVKDSRLRCLIELPDTDDASPCTQ